MPPLRLSFLGRFCLSLIAFAALIFCLYVVEAVLFYAPAPSHSAYDIAPQWRAAQAQQQAMPGQTVTAAAPPLQSAAAAPADRAAMAAAGGLQESDAITPFLGKADEARGRRVFARCAACHTVRPGGGNRVGPALWGIAGRPVARAPGFSYSAAFKLFAQKQKNWDLAALDRFLAAPAKTVPGTIMFYSGVKDLQERADLLLYLQSLQP